MCLGAGGRLDMSVILNLSSKAFVHLNKTITLYSERTTLGTFILPKEIDNNSDPWLEMMQSKAVRKMSQ